jgi:hypothetical protein
MTVTHQPFNEGGTMARLSRVAIRTAVATLAAGGALLVVPQAASAAPAEPAAAIANPAPSCVRIDRTSRLGIYWNYKATNNCSTQQRVKLVFRYSPDTGCWILDPGKSKSDWRGKAIIFDGAERC